MRKKDRLLIQKFVKHDGGIAIAWAGMGSLKFSDDVTHDVSSRMNSVVCRIILSANLQKRHPILNFIMQQGCTLPTQQRTSPWTKSGRY